MKPEDFERLMDAIGPELEEKLRQQANPNPPSPTKMVQVTVEDLSECPKSSSEECRECPDQLKANGNIMILGASIISTIASQVGCDHGTNIACDAFLSATLIPAFLNITSRDEFERHVQEIRSIVIEEIMKRQKEIEEEV